VSARQAGGAPAHAAIRIVPQEEIGRGASESPPIRLPERGSFFVARAERLRVLAARQSDGSYLELLALVSDAQQAALAAHPGVPAWRDALKTIAAQLAPRLPMRTASFVSGLASASPAYLETLGRRVMDFDYPALEARVVPFVGAALQVHRLAHAVSLGASAFRQAGLSNACPVCGSPPVAGALRIDVPIAGSRYLHCALCGADWHVPRGQCPQCDAREKLAYFHVEGGGELVKAEACDECRTYLKVVNQEKDPLADPVADDLATLALDVLMDESGYQRAGPNLFFVPGQT